METSSQSQESARPVKGAERVEARQLVWPSLLLLTFFTVLGFLRIADADEGFYLMAAKQVYQGKLLYRDFLFVQMPLFPYLYGLWLKLFGYSWYTARALSAVIAAALGVLLYAYSLGRSGCKEVAGWAAAYYATSAPVVIWFVTAKTYGIGSLLLVGSVLLLELERRSDQPRSMALWAGVLAGLCVDVRLMLAVPVAVLSLFVPWKSLKAYVLGGLLGLLPSLALYLLSPEAFYFDNLGYHAIRSSAGLIGNLDQKLAAAKLLLGAWSDPELSRLQILLTLILLACALAKGMISRLPFCVALGLILVSFLPTPVYLQYFSILIPFWVLSMLPLATSLAAHKYGKLALGSILAIQVAGLASVVLGQNGPGVWQSPTAVDQHPRALSSLRAVSRQIADRSSAGEQVLVKWPGYLIEVDRKYVPGTENSFPYQQRAFERLTTQDANRFRIMTEVQLYQLIADRKVRVIVTGDGFRDEADVMSFSRHVQDSGYKEVWKTGWLSIFSLPDHPGKPETTSSSTEPG